KRLHVAAFVAIGILQTDIENMRAAPYLKASDLGRFFDLALGDKPLELAAAEHVGALADHDRPRAVVDYQRLDTRDHAAFDVRDLAPPMPRGHRAERPDVRGRRPAASPEQVDPARFDKALELVRQHDWCFVITQFLVREPRVGHAGDRKAAEGGERA